MPRAEPPAPTGGAEAACTEIERSRRWSRRTTRPRTSRRSSAGCRRSSTTSSSSTTPAPTTPPTIAASTGDPRVDVIRHERNQGVGGAILTAHRRALELGSDIDVVFAGDDQMDPRVPARAPRPDRRSGIRVHEGEPLLLALVVRGDAAPPCRRQHRAVVPHEVRERLLAPLRPAERLHRDQPRGARAPALRRDRHGLRVRERLPHQPEHRRHPRPRRVGARAATATRSRASGCGASSPRSAGCSSAASGSG